MFKRILQVGGLTQTQFAERAGVLKQRISTQMKSKSLAFLFVVVKALNAKLVIEYADGMRLDLTPFADEFRAAKRPDVSAKFKRRADELQRQKLQD